MKTLLLLIPLLLLLAGCTTPAPQRVVVPRDFYGNVIEQTWLTDDTIRVVYQTAVGIPHGHGVTLAELHAAEAGLAKGWTHIIDYDTSWERQSHTYTMPGRSDTVAWGRGSATGRDDRADLDVFAHGTTTHTPAREMTGYTRVVTVVATFGHGGGPPMAEAVEAERRSYGW